jgi:23S rRNA pseudouridine1911/1915/1917 synthase
MENEITVNNPITKENAIGVRMKTCDSGKESTTIIKPIEYYQEKNQTLIEAKPITGRQHQIRVHTYSIEHPIVGDPIYGVEDSIADAYLLKKLSYEERMKHIGYERLMLHAYNLQFEYNDREYNIFSKQTFGYN